MKKVNLCVSICFIALILTGCEIPFGRYKPTTLELMKKTDPVEDYQKLETLFKKYGGNLASPEDTVVKWKDTQLCRIYEFKYHTVVVFPFNWNDKCFDIYLVAGHFNNYNNLLDDIWPNCAKYPPIKITANTEKNKICNFSQFAIGRKYSEEQINFIIKHSIYSSGFFDYTKKKSIKLPYADLSGEKNGYYYHMMFYKSKSYWVNITTPQTPRFTDYSINHYKLKIITEGEFRLPISEQRVPSEKK